MKKIIASDYDGTLRSGDYLEQNLEAVRRWRAAGHLFGIVSGRGLQFAANLEEQQVPFDFLLANGGGSCLREGRLEYFEGSEIALAKEAVELLAAEGALYVSVIGQEEIVSFHTYELPEHYGEMKAFAQISVKCSDFEAAGRIVEQVNRVFAGKITAFQNNIYIDIIKAGLSKAVAVERLAELYHIPHENVYVVGDNYNDISMLDAFNSYVVADGPEEVRRHASCSVVENVAEMIEELMKWEES